MNLTLIDWSIVAAGLLLMTLAALSAKRYTNNVADFLSANRCAERYLLAVSDGIAGIGVITVVAMFEAYYAAGFSFIWWGLSTYVIINFISLSGWIVYRYRQTRAMTLAQFFEMRYSRSFRILCGIVMFLSGAINFGLFPAVEARFFMYLLGISPHEVQVFGLFHVDVVYCAFLIFLIAISLFYVFIGGQIAAMAVGFVQGTLFNLFLCITVGFLIYKFPWSDVVEALSNRPVGESMLHPFQATSTKDFNVFYYLIFAFGTFYGIISWQGTQGYFTSAVNAHEARIGKVLGSWRTLTQNLMVFVIPIFAYTLMHHPAWSEQAANVKNALAGIGDETLQKQLTTTLTLPQFLPKILMGGFCAAMFSASISTLGPYMQSWGSIFIQDVYLPLKKEPRLDPRTHMKLLHRAIYGVGLFAFVFSLLFPQNDYIYMFFANTGTIWLGGAGAVIIGGLYWKKGTTAGAYSAVFVGIIVAVLGFVLPRIWPTVYGSQFPINSQWMWLIAMLIAIVSYGAVSLLTFKKDFNLDQLLHRGIYAVKDDAVNDKPSRGFLSIMGIDNNFSFKDKVLYGWVTGFSLILGIIFVIGTCYNLLFWVSSESWTQFWYFYLWGSLFLGSITTVWFSWGAGVNLKNMYHRLKTKVRDDTDNGSVHNPQMK